MSPAVEVQSPNHWTAREVPVVVALYRRHSAGHRNCHLLQVVSVICEDGESRETVVPLLRPQ